MRKNYVIRKNANIKGSEVEELRTSVGWDDMSGKYNRILERVYAHYSVRAQDQLIGFLSVISDGIGDAFLVDLMIRPEFQRRGIATEMVKTALLDLRTEGVKCVQVIFDPESETFFKGLGFHILKAGIIDNDTMKLEL